MNPTILIDLDGVLCDFVSGVCEVLNKSYPNPYPYGTYDISESLGTTQAEMWKEIDKHGYEFWANLKEYPYAKELYNKLNSKHEVYFCSTPSQHPESLKGKLIWLNRFVGGTCRNYIFTPHKHLLANPSAILIDDYEKNTFLFREHKGNSIVFPQDWNSLYPFISHQLGYIELKLNGLISGSFSWSSWDEDDA